MCIAFFFLNKERTKEKKEMEQRLKEKKRNRWTISKREINDVNMHTIKSTFPRISGLP